jgi:transcriptional regulator with XRE-family HTH domain
VGPAVSPPSDLGRLPKRIAAVRQSLALSQRAFAARVGVTRNTMVNWERGHYRPRAHSLERIASVGGVTIIWLLQGTAAQLPAIGPDPQFAEAVVRLRVAWEVPTRRARVLRMLRQLGPPSRRELTVKPRAMPGSGSSMAPCARLAASKPFQSSS